MSKQPFNVGGQAIIEGVMMRSPNHYVMAVRRSNDEIVVESRKYISLIQRSAFWKLPLLRGIAVLYESMLLGMKSLMFSNEIMMADLDREAAEKKKAKGKAPKKKKKETAFGNVLKFLGMILYFAFVFGVAIFLFKFLPLFVADKASAASVTIESNYLLFNLIDGATKVGVFVIYILLISLMPDIRRVFAYHGAEHQAIWAWEKGKELTIKNAQEEHPEHPRCGTSFIILVLLLSVVVYTFLPNHDSFQVKLLERVAALPLIAGLSYEVLKISAKHEGRWWMHWITVPGLWLQKITTRKPTDDMEEVAIAALEGALKAEGVK
jgi:uncharacterized protein YqhQ